MSILTVSSLLCALVAVIFACKLLWRFDWVAAWFRGCFGLALFIIAALLALAVKDLTSYHPFDETKPLGVISLLKLDEQHYRANLSLAHSERELIFNLRGDQWLMEAKMLRYQGVFEALGLQPLYRLSRISGRFYSLEQERLSDKTEYELALSHQSVDLWYWFNNKLDAYFPLFTANYSTPVYLPMMDGAMYQIGLSSTGLIASPINSVAEEAVRDWQI